jgi:hypothetical protein
VDEIASRGDLHVYAYARDGVGRPLIMARAAVAKRKPATTKPGRAAKAKAAASPKQAPAPAAKKKAAAARKAPAPAKSRTAAKPLPAPKKKSTMAKAQAKSARVPKRAAKVVQTPAAQTPAIEAVAAPPPVMPVAAAPAAVTSSPSHRRSVINEPESVDILLGFETSDDVAERKLWFDIRDRAAYVLVSGALPTHLRPGSVRLLRQMTAISKEPSAIDGSAGAVKLRDSYVRSFRLQEHPLVVQARRYVKQGYHLSVRRGPNERRPFGRVWLYRPVDEARAYKATIHSSGAVQAGWV